jgi:hypothetical protein
VDDVRALVDAALFGFLADRRRALPDAEPLINEIERVARAGGKRLRPAFCIWAYRAGSGDDSEAIARAAGALELLHTFAPGLYGRILAPAFEAGNYGRRPIEPTAGHVLAPRPGGRTIDGGWRGHRRALARAFADAIRGALRGAFGR